MIEVLSYTWIYYSMYIHITYYSTLKEVIMTRGGITKEDVLKARDSLLHKGENPSIDAIRAELGNTGSKTTIHRYLKELEKSESTRLDDEALLSNTLKEMIVTLASRLHQEANAVIEDAKTHHQKQQIEWKKQSEIQITALSDAKKRITSLEDHLAETEQKLSNTIEHLHETTVEVQRLAQQVSDYDILIADKNNQIQSLEEKHQLSHETHEHYAQSVQEQHDRDQQRNAQQIQDLKEEQRQLKQTVSTKLKEIAQLNKENAKLGEKAYQNEAQISILSDESEKLGEELKTTAGKVNSLTVHLSEKELSIDKKTRKINSLENKIAESEKTIKGLDIQLAEIKTELRIKDKLFKQFERVFRILCQVSGLNIEHVI